VAHCTVVGRNYGVASGNYGLYANDGCVIKDCTSRYNIGSGTDISGIRAANNCMLIGCAVTTNSNYGILTGSNCVVQGCSSVANLSNAVGIMTGASSTVRGCSAAGNNLGVQAGSPSTTVEGCIASGNSSVGIYISADGCSVLNNTCDGNGVGTTSGVGIQCNASYNRIEGNHLANNSPRGVQVFSSASSLHNVVTRNSSMTNAVQTIGYDVNTSTSDIGPIGKAATATNPWANVQ
jgi:parallel beta-helix repeat protein